MSSAANDVKLCRVSRLIYLDLRKFHFFIEQKKFFKKLTKKKKTFLLSHFGNSFTADSFCDEETFLQQISQKANPKFSSLCS